MLGEREVLAPDGALCVVRTSGAGVPRASFYNLFPSVVSGLFWFLRRQKRWQVEVLQTDGLGVTYPPVLREKFDDLAIAETHAAELAVALGAGKLGWDRWQRPLHESD